MILETMMAKKILIIDDDADNTGAVTKLLEKAGYQLHVAASGSEGIKQAKTWKPHLVILDLLMKSRTEGFDVSRKLAALPEIKGIPVLLITGVRKAFHLPFALEPDEKWLPVTQVLEKPLQNGRLLKAVADVIGAT